MSETKWTPGPWQVDPEYTDDVRDATGINLVAQAYVIPVARGGGHVRRANARLIAAAPELYAALDETVRAMSAVMRALAEEDDAVVARVTDRVSGFNGFGVRARIALAKARGD